jgi:hypothetical protein
MELKEVIQILESVPLFPGEIPDDIYKQVVAIVSFGGRVEIEQMIRDAATTTRDELINFLKEKMEGKNNGQISN